MLLLGISAAAILFLVGYAVAVGAARRRANTAALRADAAYEELEGRLAKVGAGLGIGA